jgi:hypothetical protein
VPLAQAVDGNHMHNKADHICHLLQFSQPPDQTHGRCVFTAFSSPICDLSQDSPGISTNYRKEINKDRL